MNSAKKSICVAVVLVIVVTLTTVTGLYFTFVTHVMTKSSPDGLHTAKLHRINGIDVNFKVTVDGESVYSSADFAPVDADFREQIVWNIDGNIVVLEVGGERLFGFDAAKKQSLTDDELRTVQFTALDELGYEGTLPSAAASE